jgi:hypothetical protein
MKDDIKDNNVKMITSHPDFMKHQYDGSTPTRAEKLATVGVYVCSFLAVAIWAVVYAIQALAPERGQMPGPWYN